MQEVLGNVVIPKETVTQVNLDTATITHLIGADTIGYENELYFYHGNHLSSTQLVTDANGQVQQQVFYAPFGEVISESNAYWHNGQIPDFMFNAKELDEENGMYYYSARYYAPPVFTSRDPLFEKYPTLSPYTYCANNPLRFIDPTGMLIDDYTAKLDGTIECKKTNDAFDRFYVEKQDGSTPQVAQLNKHTTTNGTTLVDFPASGTGFQRYGTIETGGDHSVQPAVAAALFGAINEITTNDPTVTVQLGDMSASNGNKPGTVHTGGATSHLNGRNVDVRYVRNDRQLSPVTVTDTQFDTKASQSVVNSFNKFGFKSILSNPDLNGNLLQNTTSFRGHHNHLHLQGFSPKIKIL
jgi:RHS repeat-associated protein